MQSLILDPFLCNAGLDLLMDGVLLWVAAAVVKHPLKWRRLIAGAFLGGIYNLWLSLAEPGVLPGWPVLSHPLFLFGVLPISMLCVAFAPARPRRFIQLGFTFFLFAFLSWGLGNMLYYYMGLHGSSFNSFLFLLLQAGLTLVVAELGWGVLHTHAVARICSVPLQLEFGEASLQAQGYLDSGNRLRDPLTRQPVVVVDYSLFRDLLSPAARAFVEALADGGTPPKLPPDDPWLPRLRVIPYHTVKRSGIMPGLRIDRLQVGKGDEAIAHRSIVIGLELSRALAKESCQALVPPALWSF